MWLLILLTIPAKIIDKSTGLTAIKVKRR